MTEKESRIRSGRILAKDLRMIRQRRDVEIRDVIEATRLADDVIAQFEQTALLDNPVFNRVYLRSLVSSYAGVVRIDEERALEALDEALAGDYDGALGKKYLPKSMQTHHPGSENPGEDEEPEEAEPVDEIDEDMSRASESSPETNLVYELANELGAGSSDNRTADDDDTDASDNDDPVEPSSETSPAGESEEFGPPGGLTPPEIPAILTADTGGGKGFLLPNMSGLAAAVIAGLVLIAMVWFAVRWILEQSGAPDEGPPPAQDTTQVEVETGPERLVLADTFNVYVIGRDEPLDPIRAILDDGLRRPFWVEVGDTLDEDIYTPGVQVFRVADRLVLEREVDNALVVVDSFVPPSRWLEPTGRYEISRERTQAWLDSLIAEGVYPPAAPDSL